MRRRLLAAGAGMVGGMALLVGLAQAANGAPAGTTLLGAALILVMALGLGVLSVARPAPSPARPAPSPAARPVPSGMPLPDSLRALDAEEVNTRLLAAIQGLSPAQFEHFCGLLLDKMGYEQVQVQGKTGDGGVDLTMYHDGVLVIAQCKRYQGNVGAPALREFYGTLMHTGARHGFFITTSDFTHAARDWVQGKPITLINGPRLVSSVRRYLLAE